MSALARITPPLVRADTPLVLKYPMFFALLRTSIREETPLPIVQKMFALDNSLSPLTADVLYGQLLIQYNNNSVGGWPISLKS